MRAWGGVQYGLRPFAEHVAQRAREPIQLPNDNVTGAKLIKEPLELESLPTFAENRPVKDMFAPSRFPAAT